MNLSRRLLSLALSMSLSLGGAACSCAESKSNVYDNTPKNIKAAIATLGVTTVGFFLTTLYYKNSNDIKKKRNDEVTELVSLRKTLCAMQQEYDRLKLLSASCGCSKAGVGSIHRMYILQLALIEHMMMKASVSENIEACNNLKLCRDYVMAQLTFNFVEVKRLAKELNALRSKLYKDGNIDAGSEIEREDLVMCNVNYTYYLPIDIQYCGIIGEDGVVHAISTATMGVLPDKFKKHCLTCDREVHYFALNDHEHAYV